MRRRGRETRENKAERGFVYCLLVLLILATVLMWMVSCIFFGSGV